MQDISVTWMMAALSVGLKVQGPASNLEPFLGLVPLVAQKGCQGQEAAACIKQLCRLYAVVVT